MNEKQMMERLGRPDETIGYGDGAYLFRRQGLLIAFGLKGAYMVATTKPEFATSDGIAVGISLKGIRAKWGEPTDSREVGQCLGVGCEELKVEKMQYCFRNGMQVEVDEVSQRVTLLQVQSGGCALS
jgi:hypothetical protein